MTLSTHDEVAAVMQQFEQLKLKYGVQQWGDLYDIPQARKELIVLLKPFLSIQKSKGAP
jgi:hypothetical protein